MSLMRIPQPSSSLIVLAMLAALAFSGCATPRVRHVGLHRTVEVYCLRGLLDVFSLGLNDLSERLRSEGIYAITVSGPLWPGLARKIHRAQLRGDLQEPLILVGHSYGADNAVRLARKLGGWNIDVELLVLLDATSPPPLPSNVARCLHVYRPTTVGNLFPFLFAGNPVDAEEGNHRTEIVNKIVSREDFGEAAARIDHFSIDASVAVHDLVLKEILRICPSGVALKRGVPTGSGGQLSGLSRGGG